MTTTISIETMKVDAFFQLLTEEVWRNTARRNQRTPEGNWAIWLILAGRGWGKTRTGAQDCALYGMKRANSRIAIVAPTFADARDVCVEGDSGILNILGTSVLVWNRSYGEIILKNGTRYKLFSADEPERLRGPQHHRAWCDELAAWVRPEAFDQLCFGMRLGKKPRIVATTTPRPTAFIKGLVKRSDVKVTRGSTYDNAANLAKSALAMYEERYRGTRLGRQELDAEILDDHENALWQREAFDAQRVTNVPPLTRVIVALDPAVTSKRHSDQTGIICAGMDANGHAYVLADASGKYSPDGWARAARALAAAHGATQIVGETNQGGDLIARVLQATQNAEENNAPPIAYKGVHAGIGKVGRAIPVAALYEQGRVHHVGALGALEDQLCRLTLQGYEPPEHSDDSKSPDRADALVWAITELLLQRQAAPGLTIL